MVEYQIQPSPILRTSKNVFSGGVEGLWTPTVTFSTPGDLNVVYQDRFGSYRRFGNLCYVDFQVITGSFTYATSADNLLIDGLPFVRATANNGWPDEYIGPLSWTGITKVGYTEIKLLISSTAPQIQFQASGSGVGVSKLTTLDVPSGGNIYLVGNVTYRIDAN